jgi:very-short-patch-repair endonuclease
MIEHNYNLGIMPPKRSTAKILHRAWELRKELTPAEIKLWSNLRILREDGIHFRRQHAIGSYITDFCAPRYHLVIELDGSQHLDQIEIDAERTAFLTSQGYQVLRFWNREVLIDINGVMGVVRRTIEEIRES